MYEVKIGNNTHLKEKKDTNTFSIEIGVFTSFITKVTNAT